MAFNVKNDETDRLVRELMELTGESLTEAVTVSVTERLDRERAARRGDESRRRAAFLAAVARLQASVIDDPRSDDEIVGYDEWGVPV